MRHSDIAIESDGKILVLVATDQEVFTLTRCNSRGEEPVPLEITNLPTEFAAGAGFCPTSLDCQDNISLVDARSGRLATIDREGRFLHGGKLPGGGVNMSNELKVDQPVPCACEISCFHISSQAVHHLVEWITKSSSWRNGIERAKSLFSRNAAFIDG